MKKWQRLRVALAQPTATCKHNKKDKKTRQHTLGGSRASSQAILVSGTTPQPRRHWLPESLSEMSHPHSALHPCLLWHSARRRHFGQACYESWVCKRCYLLGNLRRIRIRPDLGSFRLRSRLLCLALPQQEGRTFATCLSGRPTMSSDDKVKPAAP